MQWRVWKILTGCRAIVNLRMTTTFPAPGNRDGQCYSSAVQCMDRITSRPLPAELELSMWRIVEWREKFTGKLPIKPRVTIKLLAASARNEPFTTAVKTHRSWMVVQHNTIEQHLLEVGAFCSPSSQHTPLLLLMFFICCKFVWNYWLRKRCWFKGCRL